MQHDNGGVAGRRVLVVNDTQEILELFDAILAELGLDVVQMSYAPRELERVREVAPDLIILDLIFGQQETLGWQLLQKLKMDRSLEPIPVIVCTAAIRTANELQGYLTEQGVILVIKPFTVDQLEEAVFTALNAPPSARAILGQRRRGGSAFERPRIGPAAAPTDPPGA